MVVDVVVVVVVATIWEEIMQSQITVNAECKLYKCRMFIECSGSEGTHKKSLKLKIKN